MELKCSSDGAAAAFVAKGYIVEMVLVLLALLWSSSVCQLGKLNTCSISQPLCVQPNI